MPAVQRRRRALHQVATDNMHDETARPDAGLLKPQSAEGRRDSALCGSARLAIVLVLNIAQWTNYISRICLSISIDGDEGIAAEMGWSDTQKGLVLSSFLLIVLVGLSA